MSIFRNTNPVTAMGIALVAVVAALAVVFVLRGEAPRSATDPDVTDGVDQRPTGAGTLPDAEPDVGTPSGDLRIDGITDSIDTVTPAAPGVDSIPPEGQVPSTGEDRPEPPFVEEPGAD